MANVSILWNKLSDLGVYAGGTWSGSLPITNLVEPDVQRVARSVGVLTTNTAFRVDLNAAMPVFISDFIFLNHNLTKTATVQFRVTSDAADASSGARTLDTGFLPIWEPTVLPGTLPWGMFPWDGNDTNAYPSGTAFFHHSTQIGTGQYLFVYITDTTNPAGYVQIGRFMAGTAWFPEVNMEYGAAIQWVDFSSTRRTRGGFRVTNVRPRYRKFDIEFNNLTKNEALGVAFEIDRKLGKNGNFFITFDPEDLGGFLFRRSIYAALVDTSQIKMLDETRWGWSISAEELV